MYFITYAHHLNELLVDKRVWHGCRNHIYALDMHFSHVISVGSKCIHMHAEIALSHAYLFFVDMYHTLGRMHNLGRDDKATVGVQI